jgi:hypothetical protein
MSYRTDMFEGIVRRKREIGALCIGFSVGFAIAEFFARDLFSGHHWFFLAAFPIALMILGLVYSRSASTRAS